MPKAFSEQEKEIISQRLLEQGHKQFSAYGLRKTNVEELAEAAGISKGAFYLFYESKEALFMDVAEMAEQRFRQEVLTEIERPGPSPRARLLAVFRKAFSLFRTIPILRLVNGSDFDLLYRRIPPEKLQAHLEADRQFMVDLIERCQAAGIPIQANPEEIRGLLYALVLTILHEDDLGPGNLQDTIDLLLDLTAAYCVGDIKRG